MNSHASTRPAGLLKQGEFEPSSGNIRAKD
jgi:hypothetical protein